jgi:hypothetical protein
MFSEFAEEIRSLSPTGPTERELQNFLLEDSGTIRVYSTLRLDLLWLASLQAETQC